LKKQDKVLVVEQLKENLSTAQGVIVMEYKGITVRSLHELRKALRNADSSLRVVKNTLLKIACKDTPNESLEELLGGPIAVALTDGDPAAMAKEVVNFAKGEPLLVLRGGILSGKVLATEGVKDLATLPSIDEMRAKALSVFNAPAQQFMGLLQAAPRNLLGVLNARADKMNSN